MHSQSAPSLLPALFLGALAASGLGLAGLDAARAGDDPPDRGPDWAVPTSGTNVYSIPEEVDVEIWTGHLGGDCEPKRLTTTRLFEQSYAIQVSGDTSTLAFLTSSGVAFERREGLRMTRAHLQGSYSPGLAGAASLVLSDEGRRAAYVTHEGAAETLRTTLWTVDLGATSGAKPRRLPVEVRPRRIKRGSPGTRIVPAGWSPDGGSLIYFEATPVRGRYVSVIIARDVAAQTEGEIDRSLAMIDFAIPVQTGRGSSYRVLVGKGEEVHWVYPNGAPEEALRGPSDAALVGTGIMEIVPRRGPALDLLIRMAWPVTQADGRTQSGVYRIRDARVEQLTSARGIRSCSFGPDGTVCLSDTGGIHLRRGKTESSLGFVDEDGNSRVVRDLSWHLSKPLLAITFADEILVLDLQGDLASDADLPPGWSRFVGLRPPGAPKPTLHRVIRLEGSTRPLTQALWHGDRLVWTRKLPLFEGR
jgi:hypothetical protein